MAIWVFLLSIIAHGKNVVSSLAMCSRCCACTAALWCSDCSPTQMQLSAPLRLDGHMVKCCALAGVHVDSPAAISRRMLLDINKIKENSRTPLLMSVLNYGLPAVQMGQLLPTFCCIRSCPDPVLPLLFFEDTKILTQGPVPLILPELSGMFMSA